MKRPLWRCYYPGTNAVIFVIDSTDKERIDTVKQELYFVLEEEELKNAPFVILANKQDLKGAMSDVEVNNDKGRFVIFLA
jgi:ADP-ribosylation factor-like protein 1